MVDIKKEYFWKDLLQFQKNICKTHGIQFSSVAQSGPTLCYPMNCSMPDLPVHQKLPELAQTHGH